MTVNRIRGMVALLGCLGLGCGISWAGQSASTAEESAVKQSVNNEVAAFNKKDLPAFGATFAENAQFIGLGDDIINGRKGIEDHYAMLFAGPFKQAHRTIGTQAVRFVTPDVASVTMTYQLTGMSGQGGATAPPVNGFYDWTLVKQNGRWLIAILHESLPPLAGRGR